MTYRWTSLLPRAERRKLGKALNRHSQAVQTARAEGLAEDARRFRAEGLSVDEICRRIGRGKSQVYRYLEERGVTR